VFLRGSVEPGDAGIRQTSSVSPANPTKPRSPIRSGFLAKPARKIRDPNLLRNLRPGTAEFETYSSPSSQGSEHPNKLDLVTSPLTAREIEAYRGSAKADIEKVYARLKKVPFIEDHKIVGFHSYWDRFGGESYPFVEDDAISSALRKILKERTDAHHLMLAIRAGCTRLITYDGGILRRSAEIERAFSIKVMRPSELLAEVTARLVHP
jgi:predicted nucleic acid-binding protein